MNVEDVKKSLLNAVGNPESGVFVDFADVISEAIINDCCPEDVKEVKAFTPVAEKRIVQITESR